MDVQAQQRCALTRKAPKLSRLQKPQPRKQIGLTNISSLQNVINKNCSNLQSSLLTTDSVNILSEDNYCSSLPRNDRYKDSSSDPLCSDDDDVVITGVSHIPLSYSQEALEEATNNLISALNINKQNHQTTNNSNQIDVNANNVVKTSPDEVKRNLVDAMSQAVKKRAPRGNKLIRPPPLKTKSLQQSCEALEMELLNYVEKLVDDRLSLQCTLQFRDFVSKNGSKIDERNKGLMDNCFDCIQEAITRNTLDSVVEINLKDILLLRRQNWNPPHMQDRFQKGQTSDVTWKEISMNLSGSSDSSYGDSEDTESSPGQVTTRTETSTHLIQTQQSTDSGFGEDEILWDCEEEFCKDLQEINGFSKTRLEDIPEAECQGNKEIAELLAGLQITGKNQSLVKEAEQILRSHFNERKSTSPPQVTTYQPPAPPENSSFPTSPVNCMPSQPPKADNYKLQKSVDLSKSAVPLLDHWYLLPPPPPPPMEEEESEHHPVRLNRQLSETKQRYDSIVIRQPIGAGISADLLQEIEKTMPDCIFTARGRRTMFSRYRSAMGKSCSADSEPVIHHYSKEQLLACSDSVYAKQPPTEWSYLKKVYPDICLTKVSNYFDRKFYPRNPMEKVVPSMMWQALARRDSVPSHDQAVIPEETCTW
ncbi:uncharacterized protein LOC110464799 [Mizuhopecten yessoensis]|uniref:Uncharacterized protein n=1 Tax=Mizuhopecten yessoensis TaxID=6573 RepID=A0A210PT15_MIZYE|nr:uncharacterized protein LOC110464799 [Mizuhopecten yessoensis]OWF39640.1 hypothetical protein KP79_PYT13561 [Mizuhopecten yessoensis]